jgi:heat shock transcription factor
MTRRKTWNLVSDASSDDVISWNDNGRTFTVWKPDVLESEYLPKTFKHSNFASFVRQLNNYGFRKCHSDRYEFGVEAFERNKPELLTKLKRHDAPRTKRSNPVKKGGKTDASLALQSAQESLELGAYGGLASEVEQLKRDRLLLLKEVMRLRETQHAQRDEVTRLTNRLEATENFQTQMRHFVQAVHDGENINAALRESGLAGFDADAALGPRKRRGAPRYLPTLEGSTGKQQTPTAGALPDTPGIVPPSPLSLEEIDDEALTALTPSRLNSLPWHEFLASPTNESLRSMVEDMSYEGELDAAKFDEGDEAFVSSLLDRSNSGLERQLSLSFLDSDEMTEMVKEMQIGKAASPERKPASKTSKAKGKTTTSPQKGKPGAK